MDVDHYVWPDTAGGKNGSVSRMNGSMEQIYQ